MLLCVVKPVKSVMPLLLRDNAVTTREISHFTLHTILKLFWLVGRDSKWIGFVIFGLCGCPAMADPKQSMPQPGSFVTPQARDGIQKFFDPATYHGKMIGLPSLGERQPMSDLTPENIRRFFDPNTYHGRISALPTVGPTVCLKGLTQSSLDHFFDPTSYHGQKRSLESPSTSHPAAKARMSKLELIEKFKLAAQLNGVCWEDITVP